MWILLALIFSIWMLLMRYFHLLNESNEEGYYSKISSSLVKVDKTSSQTFLDVASDRVALEEKMILSLIAVAPLLGLLGTVGGMIETFASLETMEMFKPGGGIADGISQALLTTQLGLIVAVPSLMFLKFVQKQKKQILDKLNLELNLRMVRDEV